MIRQTLETLLQPISIDRPTGDNLRYSQEYAHIRNLRRADEVLTRDELAQGIEPETTDFRMVERLTSGLLATRTKDLQLAAWYTEAKLRLDGFAGLRMGLQLTKGLIDRYWKTVYPEIEDVDDLELRAAPLEWIGSRLGESIGTLPLVKKGYTYFDFKRIRTISKQSREEAIEEGYVTPEEFDAAISDTPMLECETKVAYIHSCLAALEDLDSSCRSRFSNDTQPSFSKLRKALEEVHEACQAICRDKARREDDLTSNAPAVEKAYLAIDAEGSTGQSASQNNQQPVSPTSSDEATSRIVDLAAYLRGLNPFSPFPYIVVRALRWGELKVSDKTMLASMLVSPPSSVRQELKRLATERQWIELIEAAETAMSQEYGRGWLDLQRYTARACENLGPGYSQVRVAVTTELRNLLEVYPHLPGESFPDDTPLANKETQVWIRTELGQNLTTGTALPTLQPVTARPFSELVGRAMEEVRKGYPEVGHRILIEEIENQPTKREKFRLKIQLARFCMDVGFQAFARAVLSELTETIERMCLDQWEDPTEIASVYALFYSILENLDCPRQARDEVYRRICQLDPAQAPPK